MADARDSRDSGGRETALHLAASAAAAAASKGRKRKLATEASPEAVPETPLEEAHRLVTLLTDATEKLRQPEALFNELRLTLRRTAHQLAELAKDDDKVDAVVDAGAVEAVVPLLMLRTELPVGRDGAAAPSGDDFEKEACFALGLLAIKPQHQQRISDANAIPGLVALLKRLPPAGTAPGAAGTAGGVARRAADAITNLAHENTGIKAKIRAEGGIQPLVTLLESHDSKVQRAAAGALRTLAFKNDENKALIVECGALPHLIYMARDPDVEVHYEAVGVLGNLVHSSLEIKKRVLAEGALQPVIGLLSSACTESQREAALLLGQFATTDPDSKVRIVQRGAVRPLVEMLRKEDAQLREMAAFALGRLAQNPDNQAGIAHAGGLRPLLDLLDVKNGSLQHNAAFALYGLADNEDNVAEMVKEGAVQRLLDADLILQASKDCVAKTQKRLEEKCLGKPLSYLKYVLRPALRASSAEREMQRRVAVALAHLCRPEDAADIFGRGGGLDVLLEMLTMARPAAATASAAAAGGGATGGAAAAATAAAPAAAPAAAGAPAGGGGGGGGGGGAVAAPAAPQPGAPQPQPPAAAAAAAALAPVAAVAGAAAAAALAAAFAAQPAAAPGAAPAAAAPAAAAAAAAAAPPPSAAAPPKSPKAAAAASAAAAAATAAERDADAQRQAARALVALEDKCPAAPDTSAPAAPEPPEVKLDGRYVNAQNLNGVLSDVTFLVEDAPFYAHRVPLQAASDTFRAMFDGSYRESRSGPSAEAVLIPNIRRPVFDAMMRCIYTGKVDVPPALAAELLRAADQYLLEGLKRLCEASIGGGLTLENLGGVYDMAETHHAPALGHACVLFALRRRADICALPAGVAGFTAMAARMRDAARAHLTDLLRARAREAQQQQPAAVAAAAAAAAAAGGGGAGAGGPPGGGGPGGGAAPAAPGDAMDADAA